MNETNESFEHEGHLPIDSVLTLTMLHMEYLG
jgi:hypothetical protein